MVSVICKNPTAAAKVFLNQVKQAVSRFDFYLAKSILLQLELPHKIR